MDRVCFRDLGREWRALVLLVVVANPFGMMLPGPGRVALHPPCIVAPHVVIVEIAPPVRMIFADPVRIVLPPP